MTDQIDLDISKASLRDTRWTTTPPAPLLEGQARLTIERFGLSANNITYGAFGELMSYWEFFPVAPADQRANWGRLPVWGFGRVVDSRSSETTVGQRYFGYFPLGTELVVEPGRSDDSGFSDMAPHRSKLPLVYNRYADVRTDVLYDAGGEDVLMLLRPLFVTSFVMDDFLVDHDLFGAASAVISSASSKTAIGAAFLLHERGTHTVGLTSPSNVTFTQSLGCYDTVLTYAQVGEIDLVPSVYVDVAGRRDITHAVHEHLGSLLGHSMVVGDTHWDNADEGSGELSGPRPEFLFAPVQIAKRRRDWGRDGFEERVAQAWRRFTAFTSTWLTFERPNSTESIEAAYRRLLDGNVDPRVGFDCSLTRL